MGEVLNQMLENYLVSSNVQLQKGPDSLSFTINSAEGISKTTLFNILPYMHLIFFDIHARSLPGEIAENAVYHPMQFNYCVGGRIEMLLDDNSYIYLKEKDFCISRQTSQSESYFLRSIITVSPCILTLIFSQKPTPIWIIFSI